MVNPMSIVNKCLGKGLMIKRDMISKNASTAGTAFGGGPTYSGSFIPTPQAPVTRTYSDSSMQIPNTNLTRQQVRDVWNSNPSLRASVPGTTADQLIKNNPGLIRDIDRFTGSFSPTRLQTPNQANNSLTSGVHVKGYVPTVKEINIMQGRQPAPSQPKSQMAQALGVPQSVVDKYAVGPSKGITIYPDGSRKIVNYYPNMTIQSIETIQKPKHFLDLNIFK